MAEAGFKHSNAFVLGTAGSTAVPPGGFRSLAGFWAGGAGGYWRGGFNSLLAFWMGGACGFRPPVFPIPPEVEPISHVKLKKHKSYEEEDLLVLIPCFLAIIEEDR